MVGEPRLVPPGDDASECSSGLGPQPAGEAAVRTHCPGGASLDNAFDLNDGHPACGLGCLISVLPCGPRSRSVSFAWQKPHSSSHSAPLEWGTLNVDRPV